MFIAGYNLRPLPLQPTDHEILCRIDVGHVQKLRSGAALHYFTPHGL